MDIRQATVGRPSIPRNLEVEPWLTVSPGRRPIRHAECQLAQLAGKLHLQILYVVLSPPYMQACRRAGRLMRDQEGRVDAGDRGADIQISTTP